MSKSNAAENDYLKLIYNAVAIAALADNAASGALANIYVALHTADPGEGGTQSTSEVAYAGYTRMPVPRTVGGWTVTGNSVSPAATISFPAGTGGGETATHFSTGVAASGATKILHSGPITPNIITGPGAIPELTTGTVITED